MEQNQTNTTPPVRVNNVPPAQPPVPDTPPATQPPVFPKESGGMGPVVGIIIIIAVLVFGGLYFWGMQLDEQAQVNEEAALDAPVDDSAAPANADPAQIESDLEAFDATNFESQLQADLNQIEAAF